MDWEQFVVLCDKFKYVIGVLGLLGIETAPFIKLNPIKFIFSYVGKLMFADQMQSLKQEMDKKFEEQDKKINSISEELKVVGKVAIDDHVKTQRNAIFDFGRRCRKGEYGTNENFVEALKQLKEYEEFCEKHGVDNNAMPLEAKYIKDLYNKLSLEGYFAKEENKD